MVKTNLKVGDVVRIDDRCYPMFIVTKTCMGDLQIVGFDDYWGDDEPIARIATLERCDGKSFIEINPSNMKDAVETTRIDVYEDDLVLIESRRF